MGKTVRGKIDYDKRFSRMQQHSGEHIVSGLLFRHFGCHNLGFHLGEETVTLDIDGLLTREDLAMIEWEANEAVAANLPVQVSYPGPEELENIEYRSKKEIEGQVRLVTIPGYDVCACCAPHVKQTGEIGIIKLTGMMHYKGGTRISMLCGFRALRDYRVKGENVLRISNILSVKQQETAEGVARLLKEVQAEKERNRILQERLLAQEMKNAWEEEGFCLLFTREADRNILRRLLQQKAADTGKLCGAFLEDETGGCQYLLVREGGDLRPLAAAMNRDLNGKGGGKPQLVQGSVAASREEIQEWMKREVALR